MSFRVTLMDKATQAKYFAGLMPADIYDCLSQENFFLVGAMDETGPIGAAVVQLRGELGELDWLCAAEDHRREQVGTQLLLECVRVLRQLECEGLYAVCLPGDEAMSALLEGFGMTQEVEKAWEFTLAQVREKLPESKQLRTLALEDVPAFRFLDYIKRVFPAADGAISRDDFHPQMSRLVMENSAICGAVLIQQDEDGLSVGWLHAGGKDKNAVLHLLRDAVTVASGLVSGDTAVRFLSQSEAVERLAEKLVGDDSRRWNEERWSLEGARFRLKGYENIRIDDELDEQEVQA